MKTSRDRERERQTERKQSEASRNGLLFSLSYIKLKMFFRLTVGKFGVFFADYRYYFFIDDKTTIILQRTGVTMVSVAADEHSVKNIFFFKTAFQTIESFMYTEFFDYGKNFFNGNISFGKFKIILQSLDI